MVALGVEKKRAVSRSQLPIILEKVAVAVFDRLLFENYGIKLNSTERKWFALDGKELRGSIEKGNTRGAGGGVGNRSREPSKFSLGLLLRQKRIRNGDRARVVEKQ